MGLRNILSRKRDDNSERKIVWTCRKCAKVWQTPIAVCSTPNVRGGDEDCEITSICDDCIEQTFSPNLRDKTG